MGKEFCSCEEIAMMFEKILAILEQTGGAPAGSVSMGRKKRAPSEYNLFIKECATGGQKTLKECSVDYKLKKEV